MVDEFEEIGCMAGEAVPILKPSRIGGYETP